MDEAMARELVIPGLRRLGSGGGGCINEGVIYKAEGGQKIFVKVNKKSEARQMFDGEMASLNAIHAVDVIKVPKPMKVIDLPGGGAALAMEYIDLQGLSKYSSELGQKLANLHKHNTDVAKQANKSEGFVGQGEHTSSVNKFGFDNVTCCGYLPQDNTWDESWTNFYANKLNYQLLKIEKESRDREARELWSQLQHKLPKFFEGLDIKPALMHGDLWGGNAGETDSEPVIFDCASFYGHSEYDLAITTMFGGFSQSFFNAYFKVLPKENGYSDRLELYKLFHYLNHWNHFGTGYRGSSISIMKKLVKS